MLAKYEIGIDADKRIEWLDKRIELTDLQKEYVRFQIVEAVTEAHIMLIDKI